MVSFPVYLHSLFVVIALMAVQRLRIRGQHSSNANFEKKPKGFVISLFATVEIRIEIFICSFPCGAWRRQDLRGIFTRLKTAVALWSIVLWLFVVCWWPKTNKSHRKENKQSQYIFIPQPKKKTKYIFICSLPKVSLDTFNDCSWFFRSTQSFSW